MNNKKNTMIMSYDDHNTGDLLSRGHCFISRGLHQKIKSITQPTCLILKDANQVKQIMSQ